ncbi:MAG: hypothetical protein ACYCOU_06730, partial [Sulfobacillus sp.]
MFSRVHRIVRYLINNHDFAYVNKSDYQTARPQTSDGKTSNLRPQTSDLRPQTSDGKTSDGKTSDLRPQTSDLRPQTSDLRPRPSDL